jgi:hypothetical protein
MTETETHRNGRTPENAHDSSGSSSRHQQFVHRSPTTRIRPGVHFPTPPWILQIATQFRLDFDTPSSMLKAILVQSPPITGQVLFASELVTMANWHVYNDYNLTAIVSSGILQPISPVPGDRVRVYNRVLNWRIPCDPSKINNQS